MATTNIFREVTTTKIEMAKIDMKDGEVKAVTLPFETVVGNVDKEKATRLMKKKHGDVTVTAVTPETTRYKMPVLQFMEIAEKVAEEDETTDSE